MAIAVRSAAARSVARARLVEPALALPSERDHAEAEVDPIPPHDEQQVDEGHRADVRAGVDAPGGGPAVAGRERDRMGGVRGDLGREGVARVGRNPDRRAEVEGAVVRLADEDGRLVRPRQGRRALEQLLKGRFEVGAAGDGGRGAGEQIRRVRGLGMVGHGVPPRRGPTTGVRGRDAGIIRVRAEHRRHGLARRDADCRSSHPILAA